MDNQKKKKLIKDDITIDYKKMNTSKQIKIRTQSKEYFNLRNYHITHTEFNNLVISLSNSLN